jgi:hypothetical protein
MDERQEKKEENERWPDSRSSKTKTIVRQTLNTALH